MRIEEFIEKLEERIVALNGNGWADYNMGYATAKGEALMEIYKLKREALNNKS